MKITEVEYGELQTTNGFNNVKISMRARVEKGDDENTILAALRLAVKEKIEEKVLAPKISDSREELEMLQSRIVGKEIELGKLIQKIQKANSFLAKDDSDEERKED